MEEKHGTKDLMELMQAYEPDPESPERLRIIQAGLGRRGPEQEPVRRGQQEREPLRMRVPRSGKDRRGAAAG